MKKMKRHALSLFVTTGILFVVQSPAFAQGSSDSASLEEVVVTAQKRSENLQDVPISITAVTEAKLQASGVRSTDDLPLLAPGLSVGRQTAGSVIFIRGIGTQNGAAGEEASVATYVDGVYMVSPSGNVFSFNNVERIEVLKGPQGTLFGRNATGGLINIITKEPSHTPSGTAGLAYGDYQTVEAKFYGTTGLSDTVAVDLAASYINQGDGFGVNRATGNDVNRGKDFSLRSKMLITPNDDLKVTLAGDYTYSKSSYGIARQIAPGALAVDGQTRYTGSWQDLNEKIDPFIQVRRGGVSARVDYELGDVKLVNITALRKDKIRQTFNQDSTPLGLVGIDIDIKDRFFTEELQLLSNNDSNLKWIVGGFFMKAKSQYTPLGLFGPAIGGSLEFFRTQLTTSYAAFAETTYNFTDDTSLTAGIRWTSDTRKLSGQNVFDGTVIGSNSQKKTWKKPTWRLSGQHKLTPDTLIYLSYNRGFKSGVFSNVTYTDPPANPESLDAYEIGVKSSFLDNRLRFNGAAFFYKYKDIQVTKAVQGSLSVVNAARAEIKGAEAELDAAVNKYVNLHAGISYLDATYTDFIGGPTWIPDNVNGGNALTSSDLTGNRIIRTPKVAFNLAMNVGVPTSIGKLGLDMNYYHSSSFAWEADNHLKQGAYGVANAQAYWESDDERWKVRFYVKNLTDKKYSNYSESTGVGDMITAAPPRTYGLGVDLSF